MTGGEIKDLITMASSNWTAGDGVTEIFPTIESSSQQVNFTTSYMTTEPNPPVNFTTSHMTTEPNIIVHVSSTAEIIITVYMGLLCFFGIVNNSVVLYLYWRCKTLQRPVNLFLVNISLSDLTVSLFGSTFMFASSVAGYWLFGNAGCAWYGFITTIGGCEQVVALAAVSMQRCLLVVRPMTAKKMTIPMACGVLACTWIYCLVIAVPPIFGWNSYVIEGAGTACSVNWISRTRNDTSYIYFIFLMVLAVPLTLIVGSYSLLLYAVKKIEASEAGRSSTQKADKKVTIMVVIMITCFLIAWTPYSVFALYVAAGNENNITPLWGTAPSLFAKACTVYNPIIYFLMNRKFKEALIDWLFCGRDPFHRDESTSGEEEHRLNNHTVSHKVADQQRRQRHHSVMTESEDIGPYTPLPVRHLRMHVLPANLGNKVDNAAMKLHELPGGSTTSADLNKTDPGFSDPDSGEMDAPASTQFTTTGNALVVNEASTTHRATKNLLNIGLRKNRATVHPLPCAGDGPHPPDVEV